jgi:hypothetical protein
MALWILRLIFLLVSAGLAVFIMNSPEMKDGPQWLPWTVLAGAVAVAVAVIGFDWAIRRKDLTVITAVYFGLLIGVFLLGYGVARVVGEFFRQPDAHLGFLFAGATMGQLLSLPMLLAVVKSPAVASCQTPVAIAAAVSWFVTVVTVATAVLLEEYEIFLLRIELPLQSKAVPTMDEEPFTGSDKVAGATEIVHASAMTLRSRQPASPIRAIVVVSASRVAVSVARMFALGAETRMQVRPVNKSEWAIRKGLPGSNVQLGRMVGASRNRYMAGTIRALDNLSGRSRVGKRHRELLHECSQNGIRQRPAHALTRIHRASAMDGAIGGATGTRAAVMVAGTNHPRQ